MTETATGPATVPFLQSDNNRALIFFEKRGSDVKRKHMSAVVAAGLAGLSVSLSVFLSGCGNRHRAKDGGRAG